jgi:hypothetical protein
MRRGRLGVLAVSVAIAVALSMVVLLSAKGTGESAAQQGLMQNCPEPSRWAISVWSGDDNTDTAEALGTCGEGAVAAAYLIDPLTQDWLRWFPGRPELSDLLELDNLQGIVALGAESSATPTATPSTSVTPLVTETPAATPTETAAPEPTRTVTPTPTGTATPYSDRDGDGIGDMSDNCPFDANAGQEDTCQGELGDACDCGGDWCWMTQSQLNVGFQPDTSQERIEEIAESVGATIKYDCLYLQHTWCSPDFTGDHELTYCMALLAGFEEVVYADANCVSETQ